MVSTADIALEGRIDRLVTAARRGEAPGCAIGIARDGVVLLRKGWGLASVEHGVAIGPRTVFRIASVTKQFTTAAILALALEGRLGLDDPARAHLPFLPDHGQPVLVRHLLHNVSGLRDYLELTRWGGMALDRPLSEDDLTAAIARADGLNFPPGARFLYSNTNFLLLGRIVEQIEEAPLEAVLERRFLAPLGMTRTRLVRDPAAVVPDLATAYLRRADGGIARAHQAYPTVGEGGMVSCVDDLLVWARHFERPFVGRADLVGALQVELPLTGGAAQPYTRGMEVGRWRGLRTIGHGGLWPGFRTEFLRVPERDLAIVVIANIDAIDPHALARRAVDAVLAEEGLPPDAPMPEGVAARAGRFLDPDSLTLLDVAVAAGEVTGRMNGAGFLFRPERDGWLRAFRGAFELAIRPDGDGWQADIGAGRLVRLAPAGASDAPAGLAGIYHAGEIATDWTVAERDDGVAVTARGPHASAGPWPVTPVARDVIEIAMPNRWMTSTVVAAVERDGTGRAAGLRVSSGRIKDLRFVRAG
ncbi:MAG: serine hydrolase domain-containing protein [Alphaproteobacteria bacterium]